MGENKNDIQQLKELITELYKFYEGGSDKNIGNLYLNFQLAIDNFQCFEECTHLSDFLEKLTVINGEDFNIDNSLGILNEELLKLSILNFDYEIREEWIRFIFKTNSESISEKRFKKLIKLCKEINEVEGNNLGLRCYIYFRMDTLIRRPILTINEFRNGLAECLLDKFTKYLERFIELFKEFYVIESNFNELNYDKSKICSNCNYFFSQLDEHTFCKCNKFTHKELSMGIYVLKREVYKDYTKPGLIERDAFDTLKKEGFTVELYPNIEKDGDLKVILGNENIYIDCKSSKSAENLWEEIKKEKYMERIILVPDLYYLEQKKYIEIKSNEEKENAFKVKIFNLDDLVNYLKKKKGSIINEQ